jgi:AcrR family transcriptional regulator
LDPDRSPRSRRTRRPRAERERELVEAARSVFCEFGYAHGSMAEIAERAGVVEGTIYTYFDSKQSLLLRVVSDFYAALIQDVETGLRAVRGAENRLRFLIQRHLQVFVQDLGMCRIVLSEIRPDPELYDETVRSLNRRYTSLTLDVIREGIESGALRPDLSPQVLRDLIFGGIEHVLWGHVRRGASIPVEPLGDELAELLLAGARPRPADGQVSGPDDADDPSERLARLERLERVVASLERRAETS